MQNDRNSNIPRIIDRLVAKNWVDRSTSDVDKRETVITLTADGMNVLENANQKVDVLINNTVRMSDDEALQLNTLLQNLREQE
jgi:DNA-binding MarR family transcriptional regulator